MLFNLPPAFSQTSSKQKIDKQQESVIQQLGKAQQRERDSLILLAEKNNLEELAPNNNPLVIPTRPEEVTTKQVPLSLNKAISLAINNNRELAIAQLGLDRDRASLDEARADLFPSLTVGSTLNRALSPIDEINVNTQRDSLREQLNEAPNNINNLQDRLNNSTETTEQTILQLQLQQAINAQNQAQNQLDDLDTFATTRIDSSVRLSYALFDPGRQASIKIAREQLRIQELEIQRTTEQLILDVTNAYYDLQEADRQVEIAQTDVRSRRQGLEIVTKLLDAALATRLDLLNVEVELDNAEQILRNAQAQQEIARRNLAEILSLPSEVTPVTADEVEVLGEWDLTLEDTIILALENRVELKQQLAQRRIQQANRQLAFAGIKPTLDLFANYDFLQLYSDEPGDNVLRGFGDGYSLGVNFSWTPWDGGATFARARQAKAQIAIAEQQYGDRAEQIRLEVEQAYYQLPTTFQNVQTATQALEKAEEAVDAANKRFSANLNTQTEVLDAQNRLVQAQNNLVQAILGYNRALASLQRAVGEIESEKDTDNSDRNN